MSLFEIKGFSKDSRIMKKLYKYKKSENFSMKIANLLVTKNIINPSNHRFLLTLFGIGNLRSAPGTLASLFTALLWYLSITKLFGSKSLLFPTLFWLAIIIIVFIYGTIISNCYVAKFKKEDPQYIVIDEFVGQLTSLTLSYTMLFDHFHIYTEMLLFDYFLIYLTIGNFILFRIFDISKPSIIGRVDRNVKGGLGIMLDDIIAGLFSSAVIIATSLIICNYILLQNW
jgi:phosphatidylglycerophosphatase A